MKALNNKGNISGLQSFIMGIVGVTIVLAIGFVVLAELKNSSTSETANTSIDTIVTKLGTVPNWIGIIIVVALASLVLAYFYVRQ
jgi:hypothetical protein